MRKLRDIVFSKILLITSFKDFEERKMVVKSLFLPSFRCSKNKYHTLPQLDKLISNLDIRKDGQPVVISKIYESLDLACNYDRKYSISPTIFVEDDDKVIDTDFVFSKFITLKVVLINSDYADLGIHSTFIQHVTKECFTKLN